MSACSTGNGCASGSIRCALRPSRTTAAVVGVRSSNVDFDHAWSIRDDFRLGIHAEGEGRAIACGGHAQQTRTKEKIHASCHHHGSITTHQGCKEAADRGSHAGVGVAVDGSDPVALVRIRFRHGVCSWERVK
jgi:hypothetical protein